MNLSGNVPGGSQKCPLIQQFLLESAIRAKNNRIALGYIFIAVVSYALIPTVIGHIGGE